MTQKILFPSLFFLISIVGTAQTNMPKVRIDRVEVSGVQQIDSSEVESAIELDPGEELDRNKVVQSAENLQNLYKTKGFERIRIKSELRSVKSKNGHLDNVLVFVIEENQPTRLSQVTIELVSGDNEKNPDYWRKLSATITSKMPILTGNILDQEKISEVKRMILDSLATEEFMGAKILEAISSDSRMPPPQSKEMASRWADLHLRIETGDRLTFGFRGNEFFSRTSLMSIVEDQRVVGLGKDYVQAIRARIEDEYKAVGFAQVKVKAFTFEGKEKKRERHITYLIAEGPKTYIRELSFDGNHVFSGEILSAKFFDLGSLQLKNRIFIEKDVAHTCELLMDWIKSQGYLAAKKVTINQTWNSKENEVSLVIYLYEGEQTLVQNVQVIGSKVVTAEEIAKELQNSVGSPLNLFTLSEGLEFLKSKYRAQGYLDFQILNEGTESLVRYSRDNREASITLDISEGYRFKVSRIDIEGLTKTKEEVVRREVRIRPGEYLSESEMSETEARLRKLGVFSVVTTRYMDDPEHTGHKIVRISVQEGTPGLIAGGVGFRNDLGARVFGQSAYNNLWHNNHSVFFNAAANRRFDQAFCSHVSSAKYQDDGIDHCFIEFQAAVGYVWPWFAGDELVFRPRVSFERTKYQILDADTVGTAITWERKLLENPQLTGLFTYNLERISQYNAQSDVDNQKLRIGSLIQSLYLDMRDNTLAPTKGLYSSASFEWANPIFYSQSEPFPVAYSRFQFRQDFFVPLPLRTVFFFSFRTGIARNLAQPPANATGKERLQYAIPLIKHFTLGGAGSIRGFGEQEINVRDTAVSGTLSYVNYRAQLEIPFAGALHIGPFLDMGNLYLDQYRLDSLRKGAGLGFHYMSPVGPVNFDWGFKLDPRANENPHQFYFSIGVI